MTKEYLTKAKESFSAKYTHLIKEGFDKYYEILSQGNSDREYQLNADLSITVREYGRQREIESMSEGYKDLIGLCRRMAMIDAMYESEKPFLIFDDPFVNLDNEKTAGALQFIRKISEDYQVLYMTCHDSRVIK